MLEFSPAGTAETTKLTKPSESVTEDPQPEIEFRLYGAITAIRVILPALREAGSGMLL